MKWTMVLAVAACAALAAPCGAQDRYPSRPVKLVLPQPAGGAVDLIARALADRTERAKIEKMKVQSADPKRPWTDYTVTNRLSGKSYRVALRGLDLPMRVGVLLMRPLEAPEPSLHEARVDRACRGG